MPVCLFKTHGHKTANDEEAHEPMPMPKSARMVACLPSRCLSFKMVVTLPLEISPNPESITRFHLMVSVANLNEKTDAPILEKINRSDYSVLELGAYAKK